MDINKITIETANSIKEKLTQGKRNKQSIIDEHLSDIEILSKSGVSYKELLSSCDVPIALKHFHSLIFRAKKKRKATSIENKVMPIPVTSSDKVTSQKKLSPDTNLKKTGHFSNLDWEEIGIHNEYLIKVLQETDLTPKEVKSWNFPNQIQLSTRINEYRMRKMKRK